MTDAPTPASYDAAELRKLLEAATPGPWRRFSNSIGVGVSTPHSDVAHCHGFDTGRTREEVEANAALIVAAVNALPALLETEARATAAEASLAAAKARETALEEALEWALDQSTGSDHPHYPMRGESWPWVSPYLVHGSPMGGGVGEAGFSTALEAVETARALAQHRAADENSAVARPAEQGEG